jgi:hypothetical protein
MTVTGDWCRRAGQPLAQESRMRGRRKVLVAAALVLAILGWLAWTVLTVESDLGG